jgi:hypothetical protein
MTRAEWKAFHHSIRADVRALRLQYGGWPCFSRVFHNGAQRWHFERSVDRAAPSGRTFIWRPLAEMPAALRRQRVRDIGTYRRDGDITAARKVVAVIRANA